jgi:hypothetical protein
MTREEHLKRHKELHAMLDELLADYVGKTGKRFSTSTIMELIEWSYRQTKLSTIQHDENDERNYRPYSIDG